MSLNSPNEATQSGKVLPSPELLAVPVIDTDGRFLGLSCDPTSHPAIASLDVEIGQFVVRMDVLSASHRVLARRRTSESWEVTETVACALAEGSIKPLPSEHEWSSPGWRLVLSSDIEFGEVAVSKAVTELEQIEGSSHSLIRRFPGHDSALTGLCLNNLTSELSHPGQPQAGLSWQTWHLYPGTDAHVVRTSTVALMTQPLLDPTNQSDPSSIEMSGSNHSQRERVQ